MKKKCEDELSFSFCERFHHTLYVGHYKMLQICIPTFLKSVLNIHISWSIATDRYDRTKDTDIFISRGTTEIRMAIKARAVSNPHSTAKIRSCRLPEKSLPTLGREWRDETLSECMLPGASKCKLKHQIEKSFT